MVEVGFLAVLAFFLLKGRSNMEKVFKFVHEAEGGLSRAVTDTASANPCPVPYVGKTGWHTNKGVTWTTFLGSASKLGYEPSAANFYAMPYDIWFKIAKRAYWDKYGLDNMRKKRVAACIFTWAWGSGLTGSEIQLAKFQRNYLNINDSNIDKKEIVRNFDSSMLSDKQLFLALVEARKQYFINTGQTANIEGWLSRLAKFKNQFV